MSKLICGIDEAGRGPVVGDLVVAGVLITEDQNQTLLDLGVKDSKLLSLKQRNELFDVVKKTVKEFLIISCPPEEVDDAVNGKDNLNLNKLEGVKTAEIIDKLNANTAIVDSPSNNIKAYKDFLFSRILKKETELVVEHKADLNHPSVAAASILAKVTRDRHIQQLEQKLNTKFGSGYPSDPRTVQFLEENWQKHPEIFRKSWSSYKNVAKKKGQSSLSNF